MEGNPQNEPRPLSILAGTWIRDNDGGFNNFGRVAVDTRIGGSDVADMKTNVKAFPPKSEPVVAPQRIRRPCDAGLWLAVTECETQLGTIEAYNRIVEAAEGLARKINNGKAQAANPIYLADTGAIKR
jgi:hypothetical protein